MNEMDDKLLDYNGSTAATNNYTKYNRGPRKATDRKSGIAFVLSVIAYLVWSFVELSGKIFLWDYAEHSYEVKDVGSNLQCVQKPSDIHLNITSECRNLVVELTVIPLFVSLFGAILFGVLLIVGFRYFPMVMVVVSIIFQVLIPAAVGAYLLSMGSTFAADCDTDDDYNACSTAGLNYPAYVLFAISALTAFVYFYIRRAMKFVAEILRFSAIALSHNKLLVPTKLCFYLVFIILQLGMWAAVAAYFLSGKVEYNAYSQTCDFEFAFQSKSNTEISIYCVFASIVIGWFFFWGLETRNYVVADVTGHWYYHGKEGGGNISRAVKHAFTSHFGSLAAAGFCMWFVESLKRRSKGNICGIFVRCILSYIEFLFKSGVVMMAVTGMSFGNSGIEIGKLFWTSVGSVSGVMWTLPNRMMSMLTFIVSLVLGLIYGFSAYGVVTKACQNQKLECLITNQNDDDFYVNSDQCETFGSMYGGITGGCVFFVCLVTLHFVVSILLVISDTAFVCFLLDTRDNVVTKPRIHQAFSDIIDWRNSQACCGQRKQPVAPTYLKGVAPGYKAMRVPPTYQVSQQQQPPPHQQQQQQQQQQYTIQQQQPPQQQYNIQQYPTTTIQQQQQQQQQQHHQHHQQQQQQHNIQQAPPPSYTSPMYEDK